LFGFGVYKTIEFNVQSYYMEEFFLLPLSLFNKNENETLCGCWARSSTFIYLFTLSNHIALMMIRWKKLNHFLISLDSLRSLNSSRF
jgi:hypothetical protein